MAITRTAMVDDDGTGTTGTVLNNAWKQQFYDQIDAADAAFAAAGLWTTVAHNAANFTANTGTWTVSSSTVKYSLIGKTCTVTLTLSNTTIAGSPLLLYVQIPLTIVSDAYGQALAGVSGICTIQAAAGTNKLQIIREQLAAFPAGTVTIQATVTFEVA